MREAWGRRGEHRENTRVLHRAQVAEMENGGDGEMGAGGGEDAMRMSRGVYPGALDTRVRAGGLVLGSTHARSLAPTSSMMSPAACHRAEIAELLLVGEPGAGAAALISCNCFS